MRVVNRPAEEKDFNPMEMVATFNRLLSWVEEGSIGNVDQYEE